MGASILVAGMNTMAGLYEIDPSGALLGYKATAIGEGRRVVMKFFEENYSEEMNRDDSIKLALEALRDVNEGKLTGETIDLVIIDLKDGYTKFSAEGVKIHSLLEAEKKLIFCLVSNIISDTFRTRNSMIRDFHDFI